MSIPLQASLINRVGEAAVFGDGGDAGVVLCVDGLEEIRCFCQLTGPQHVPRSVSCG